VTGSRRRILAIEDDPETAEQLIDFLVMRGYHVDLATNGREGLKLGRSAEYAVMTSDRPVGAPNGGDGASQDSGTQNLEEFDVCKWPILLQKSEIAKRQFFRQKTEVIAIADKCVSKLATEVTGVFVTGK